MTVRPLRPFLLCALTSLTLASTLDAQVRRGRAPEEAPRWAAPSVIVNAGWDSKANGEVLGASIRIPVVRSGVVEVQPGAVMTFLNNTEEYQYNLDAAWLPAGGRGGVMLGTGVAWRETIAGALLGEGRRRLMGINAFGGGRSAIGPVDVEFQLRWTFLQDTDFQPNSATLGLALPFWRVGPGR